MPERKLVKHGPSTFVVSLPKRWVDMHGFDKGDSIKYEETTEFIRYFAKEFQSKKESIEVDFTGLDRSIIMFYLRALYRLGFKEINIKFNDSQVTHHRTGKDVRVSSILLEETRRLVGIEISEHTKDSITLSQLADPKSDEIEKSMSRIFLLLNGAYDEILESMKNKDVVQMQGVEEKHDAITKLVSYSIRSLNQLYHKDDRPYLMHVLSLIDVKIDMLKYFVRQVAAKEVKFSSEAIKIFDEVRGAHKLVERLWNNWDNTSANEFDAVREVIKQNMMELEGEDAKYLFYLQPLLEIYREMILTRLCIIENDA